MGCLVNTCATPPCYEMTSDLLVRPEAFRNSIENFSYEYLPFEIRKLKQDQRYEAEARGMESVRAARALYVDERKRARHHL